jgi:integrase
MRYLKYFQSPFKKLGFQKEREMKPILQTKGIKKLLPEPLGLRDKCVVKLFTYTNIRRHELIVLDVADVNLKKKILTVQKKKGLNRLKRRKIDLPEHLVKDLKSYIGKRTRGVLFSFSVSEGSDIQQINNLLNYIKRMEKDLTAAEPRK